MMLGKPYKSSADKYISMIVTRKCVFFPTESLDLSIFFCLEKEAIIITSFFNFISPCPMDIHFDKNFGTSPAVRPQMKSFDMDSKRKVASAIALAIEFSP